MTSTRLNTQWRHPFTILRIPKDPKKSKDHGWWGKSPFRPDERTASFHLNARGWYCHATGQGGDPIELVQRLQPGMHCFDAGQWLLEHGVSRIVSNVRENLQRLDAEESGEGEELVESQAIWQTLRTQLLAGHRPFAARWISPEVYREPGAGYFDQLSPKNGRTDPGTYLAPTPALTSTRQIWHFGELSSHSTSPPHQPQNPLIQQLIRNLLRIPAAEVFGGEDGYQV